MQSREGDSPGGECWALKEGNFMSLKIGNLRDIHYDCNYELRTAFAKTGIKLIKNRFFENYTTIIFREEP
jgi:hypothetical protein